MIIGSVPNDVPYDMRPAEHAGIGVNRPYPVPGRVGAFINAEAGPATDGAVNYAGGLGGPFDNPAGFARETSPFSTGVNLRPSPTGTKGQFDISQFDPRTWFPSVMTMYHTTRKPGGAEAGGK